MIEKKIGIGVRSDKFLFAQTLDGDFFSDERMGILQKRWTNIGLSFFSSKEVVVMFIILHVGWPISHQYIILILQVEGGTQEDLLSGVAWQDSSLMKILRKMTDRCTNISCSREESGRVVF